MAGKNTAVFGIYTNRTSVERAVEAFKAAGFSNNDVSVLFPENQGTKDFAHEKSTKAPEGATTGAGTGAVIGWWVGMAGGNWRVSNSWPRPVYRCRSDHGGTGGSRSWRRSRWSYGCPDRNGHTRI